MSRMRCGWVDAFARKCGSFGGFFRAPALAAQENAASEQVKLKKIAAACKFISFMRQHHRLAQQKRPTMLRRSEKSGEEMAHFVKDEYHELYFER